MSSRDAYCEIDFPHPSRPGRLSAAFSAPECILSAATPDEVPALLAQAESHARSGHWVIGFVAYEAARAFDRALQTHDFPPAGLPFAQFAVFRDMAAPRPREAHLNGVWRDETTRRNFDAAMTQIRSGIAAGDYYQVNYTTRLHAPFFGDGLSFFDALRANQPLAYCAYLDFGAWQICSVSPELFFHWDAGDAEAGRTLTCRPMKGTAARSDDPWQDRAAAESLQNSAKERAENLMIVDLMRNDLSRVARAGSVDVPHLFSIEAWPTVWQMTSTVSCRTRAGIDLAGVFRALFPCGSVTGAPKAAAMSAIRALEASPRGVYCGAIGALRPGGEAVFSVGIRTLVTGITQTPASRAATIPYGNAECGIGSGITLDSDADREHAEWGAKQAFLMRACPEYELLETVRLHQGRYWLLRGHLARLAASARTLGFPCDEERMGHILETEARRHAKGQWRARLRLAPSGAAALDILPLDIVPAAPRFALARAPIASTNPWLRHKTTQRGLYSTLAAAQPEVFDTLLYNERGELTEFTRGNLVVELDGSLLTPAADCGLLPGVFRAALLSRRRIRECVIRVEDLTRASRICFINSVRGVVAVEPAPE